MTADRPTPPPGRIVAILRGHAPDAVDIIARALVGSGIGTVEVTLDSPGALESIRRLATLPDVVVGAGTVLSIEEADGALAAGARFLISPHVDVDLIHHVRDRGIPMLPGALTATEVLAAWTAGAAAVKLFPAGALGPGYLSALRGPLGHVPLVPTGGVDATNAAAFLRAGALALGIGTWLTGVAEASVVAERACELMQIVRAAS